MDTNPTLVPGYINLSELEKDLKAREDIWPRYTRVREIYEMLDDTLLLLGNDIYHSCIAFYKAVSAAAKANVPGSTSIYQDLAQQFPGRPKKQSGGTEPPPPQG